MMAVQTGTVVSINASRGFAFIKRDDGGPDTFFHINVVRDPVTNLDEMKYRKVGFTLTSDTLTDRPRAAEVWLA